VQIIIGIAHCLLVFEAPTMFPGHLTGIWIRFVARMKAKFGKIWAEK
jgi:hypothetical protein